MGCVNNIFSSKVRPIESYVDFWEWFAEHESAFHKIVRSKDTAKIEKDFFRPLGSKLRQIKDGYNFLVGMLDDRTVDMVFTADGDPKNIVFVEELVTAAPNVQGWVFNPAKQPASAIALNMNSNQFDEYSLTFYTKVDEY